MMPIDIIKIAGDTFTVTSNGKCAAGDWKIADAGNQLIGVVPQTIRENRADTEKRIEEVMDNNCESYQWGMFYTRINKEYCVILRGHEESSFGEILSAM
jgi:hypothetical protein